MRELIIICPYPQEEDLPAVLTVEEVRTILRIGRSAAYHLIDTGQLKRINVGGKFLTPGTSCTASSATQYSEGHPIYCKREQSWQEKPSPAKCPRHRQYPEKNCTPKRPGIHLLGSPANGGI